MTYNTVFVMWCIIFFLIGVGIGIVTIGLFGDSEKQYKKGYVDGYHDAIIKTLERLEGDGNVKERKSQK